MSPISHAKTFPPTSTPLIESASGHTLEEKSLEESYLEEGRELSETAASKSEQIVRKTGQLDISEIKKEKRTGKEKKVTISKAVKSGTKDTDTYDGQTVATPKGRKSETKGMLPTIQVTEEPDGSLYSPGPDKSGTPAVKESSFMKLMSKKSKPIPAPFKLLKPKVDLLKVAPPMTPMTPALKDVLTPSKLMPVLVPLNPLSAAQGRPLFIVHPVTGKISFLNIIKSIMIEELYH